MSRHPTTSGVARVYVAPLQAPHHQTRTPLAKLERAQLSTRLRQGDNEAYLVVLHVTTVSGTKRWQGFIPTNRTRATRRVRPGGSKPALAIGAKRFFDDAIGTVVFQTRPTLK